jgi:hypothetical protein
LAGLESIKTLQVEEMMDDSEIQNAKALVAGLLLSQQVLVEALVRQDAIGYHQLRETLAAAVEALEPLAASTPGAGVALAAMLDVLDEQHRPLGPDERPHAVDWGERLQALLQDL